MGAGRRLKSPLVDPPPVPTGTMTYTAEPLGAGGWVTGISISPDGNTRLARTDTMGLWRWDTTADKWQASINGTSMPTGFKELDAGEGVQAIASANAVAFMGYKGRIFKSTDGGLTWTAPTTTAAATAPNTGNQRWLNTRMAIDPANQDHVIYGTLSGGLLYTTDRGATWQTASGVPAGTSAWGIPCVTIDTSGNFYAAPHGAGLYRSTDAGATWTKISSDGQFIVTTGLAAGANGDVMLTGHTTTAMDAASSVVYRYRSGSLTQITSGVTGAGNVRPWRTIAYDPLNPGAMMLQGDGGYERRSNDYGTTWVESWNAFTSDAPDVPWLAAANGFSTHYFFVTVGGLQFDPVTSGRVWMSQGIGVWKADLSPTLTADVPWVAQSRGIEQLVCNDVVAPPGGSAAVVSWDRPIFLVGETTSVPVVSVSAPVTTPANYGTPLVATLVRGYPQPITYAWTTVTSPAGSTGGTFSSPSTLSSAFVADIPGAYTLRLTGTNAAGSSHVDVNLTATTAITGLLLPGVGGNYLTTPDDPSLTVTGVLTLLVRLSMASWAPSSRTTLIGQVSSAERSYILSVDSTGVQFRLATSPNGSTGYNSDILIPLTFPPGAVKWAKMVYNPTTQNVTISFSDNGTDWTVYKSVATTIPGTTLANAAAPLNVGYSVATPGIMNGKVYLAQVWNDSTLVADFNATAVTRTGVRTPATYTGSTGKVWTPQGTSWDWS